MCQSTIAIYCFIDDLLKASNHHEDKRCQINDAQVITTALIAMLYFGGNYRKSLCSIFDAEIFSNTLSPSRYSRRLNRLTDLIHLLFHQLGATLKELNYESRYSLDSYPVPMCDNIRIKRNRLTREVFDKADYHGWMASKKRYFYGVRVQVIATINNLPVEFAILPGGCADIQGLAELPLDFAPNSEIAADAAYTQNDWEDDLLKEEQIKLLVNRKKNSKRPDPPSMKDYKFWLRHRIETTFGDIGKYFPKKIHATTLNGFILKVALFLWAYQIDKAFV